MHAFVYLLSDLLKAYFSCELSPSQNWSFVAVSNLYVKGKVATNDYLDKFGNIFANFSAVKFNLCMTFTGMLWRR